MRHRRRRRYVSVRRSECIAGPVSLVDPCAKEVSAMSDAPDRKPFTTVDAQFLESGDEMNMLSEGQAAELPPVPTQRVDYFRPLPGPNRSRALIAVASESCIRRKPSRSTGSSTSTLEWSNGGARTTRRGRRSPKHSSGSPIGSFSHSPSIYRGTSPAYSASRSRRPTRPTLA